MVMIRPNGLAFTAVAIVFSVCALADEHGDEYKRIGIGVYVLNVAGLDLAGGSCYLDYLLTLKRDLTIYPSYKEAVTANGTNSADRVCYFQGEGSAWDTWDGNASDLFIVNLDAFGEVRPLGDGQFRVMGTHFFRTQLGNWPFETQELEILIELKNQMQSTNFDVVLCHIYEFSGMSSSVRFPGEKYLQLTMGHELFERCWPSLSAPNARCLHQSYISSLCPCLPPPRVFHNESDHFSCRCQGGKRLSSRYRGMINFNRPENTAFIKVYLPPLFLVLVTLLTYILPLNELATRLSICGTTLMASVFFHVSVLDQLPPTSVLTKADRLMINVYVVNLLAWLFSLVLMLLDNSDHIGKSTTHSIYSFTRIFLPILSVCSFVLSVYSGVRKWQLWLAIIGGGLGVSFVFLLIQNGVDRCLQPSTNSETCGCVKKIAWRKRRHHTPYRTKKVTTSSGSDSIELERVEGKYQTFSSKENEEIQGDQ